jgi:hypothetical protein
VLFVAQDTIKDKNIKTVYTKQGETKKNILFYLFDHDGAKIEDIVDHVQHTQKWIEKETIEKHLSQLNKYISERSY